MNASDLVIAGVEPFSAVDWPGRLVATVFLQGCPWACTWCHNHAIIDPTAPGAATWQEVGALLARRRGLLDGVVFSGGEPTRQRALLPAAAQVRAAGYQVGLHTGGAYPKLLADLLPDVDWVGLDIKALPDDYQSVVGRPGAGQRAWRSLEIVQASGVDFEVRLTIDQATAPTAPEIAKRLAARGVEHLALQRVHLTGTSQAYQQAAAQQVKGAPGDGVWFDAAARQVGARWPGELIVRD